MTFKQSVCDAFSKYATFSGRASRSAFWWFQAFCLLAIPVPLFIDVTWFSGFPIFQALAELPLLIPGIAVSVRRLHDVNRSGWWLFLALIPVLGWIPLVYFNIQSGDPDENRFGPAPVI